MIRLEKTLKSRFQQVFLLTMLALGGIFAQGMVTEAEALLHGSRACPAASVNESYTVDVFGPDSYRVTGYHYNSWDNGKTWKYWHLVTSGRYYSNSVRIYAAHWQEGPAEGFPFPKVRGFHRWRNPQTRRGELVAKTYSVADCLSRTL
jgi:hypothetical protein